jgi:DNA-binding CsgD family transcriptional regulator
MSDHVRKFTKPNTDDEPIRQFYRLTSSRSFALLGYAFLQASMGCLLRFGFVGSDSTGYITTETILIAFLVGGVVTCLALIIIGKQLALDERRRVALTSVVLIGGYAVLLILMDFRPWGLLLGALMIGVGDSLLLFFWLYRFSALSISEMVVYMIGSLLLSRVLIWSALLLQNFLSVAVVAGCFAALSCVGAFFAIPLTQKMDVDAPPPQRFLWQLPTRRPDARSIIGYLWQPLLAFMLCSMILGMTFDPVAAQIPTNVGEGMIVYMFVLFIMIIILFNKKRDDSLLASSQMLLPIAAAALLIAPFTPGTDNSLVSSISLMVGQIGFALVDSIMMLTVCIMVRQFEWQSLRVIAFYRLVGALAMLVGMLSFMLLGSSLRFVSLVLLTIYLTVLAMVSTAKLRRVGTTAKNNTDDDLSEIACHTFGLSKRETEVFVYLCRGYSSTYIAETLVLSVNTIKSHVRHIYTKMSVSSKSEFLKKVGSLENRQVTGLPRRQAGSQ